MPSGGLNIGETAIDGVPERVSRLQAAGKRMLIVSNAAGYPHADLMAKYQRLGYHFDPDDVITSRKAMLVGLADVASLRLGLMATPGLKHSDIDPLNTVYLALLQIFRRGERLAGFPFSAFRTPVG